MSSPPPPPPSFTQPRSRPKKKKNRMPQIIFVTLLLIVAAVGSAVMFKPEDKTPSNTQTQTQVPTPAEPVAPLPTDWKQQYGTTFNLGNQNVSIRNVEIRNLDQNEANVQFNIVVLKRKNPNWVKDKKYWRFGALGKTHKATRVSVRSQENNMVVVLRFKANTEDLIKGSYLQVLIPEFSAKNAKKQINQWPVKIAVEVPADHQGIKEMTGTRGM